MVRLLTARCFHCTNHSYPRRVCPWWMNAWRETRSTGWIPQISVSRWSLCEEQQTALSANAVWMRERTHPCKAPQTNDNRVALKRIYPWNGEIRHQLLEGPRLLRLLLVVQRYLFAELPGVWAACARGAWHCAGRNFTTSATSEVGGRKSGRRGWEPILWSLSVNFAGNPSEFLKHSRQHLSAKVNSKRQIGSAAVWQLSVVVSEASS